MTPEKPEPILRPVRARTIVASFAVALVLNFVPWPNVSLAPDFVALVLAFWCVHQPRLVGLGVGWMLGLLDDAGNGVLLGQHALAYALLAFGALTLSRRIRWFSAPGQMLHIAVLLAATQAVEVVVRLAAGAEFPGWQVFVGPLVAALLWPLADLALLAPQRRRVEIDETRAL
jgi:rod shape-determining protein MreD